MKTPWIALALLAASIPAAAGAQAVEVQLPPISGTRLDVTATGETSRVPDIAIISAGVITRSQTAAGAIQENAARMERMLAALKRSGVEERDIQTSSIQLNPEYHYEENRPPRLIAYQASNTLNIRFRDIRNSGRILDALVAEGANQISGPTLTLDRPELALDEARANAIARGRARADLYARSLGMQVVRVVSVSESGGYQVPPPMPMAERAMAVGAADTKIVPGEQKLQVTLAMMFELR